MAVLKPYDLVKGLLHVGRVCQFQAVRREFCLDECLNLRRTQAVHKPHITKQAQQPGLVDKRRVVVAVGERAMLVEGLAQHGLPLPRVDLLVRFHRLARQKSWPRACRA